MRKEKDSKARLLWKAVSLVNFTVGASLSKGVLRIIGYKELESDHIPVALDILNHGVETEEFTLGKRIFHGQSTLTPELLKPRKSRRFSLQAKRWSSSIWVRNPCLNPQL